MPITFFEWPSLNEDTSQCFSPYNGSMFKLRYEYPKVFAKQDKQDREKKRALEQQTQPEDPMLDYSFEEDLQVKEPAILVKARAS